MAEYDYEEGGFMSLYFVLTFLTIALIPLTTSSLLPSFKKESLDTCKCSQCTSKQRLAKRRSSFLPALSLTAILTLFLWAIFFAITYKLATTKLDSKIYDPFEILGLAPTSDEKVIKRHYKRLSLKFHPDKVRLAINQTMEEVSNKFVDLTKAYKALTDETIRENLRLYGNPDGKQDFKVGIALPPWIIESSNNGWVLGSYALLIGGVLPYFVGKWWFGSRRLTKDGVQANTAEVYFKALGEDDSVSDVLRAFAQGWEYEAESPVGAVVDASAVQAKVQEVVGADQWALVTKGANKPTIHALVLLYAHLLRIPIEDVKLRTEQEHLLARSPQMLTALLSMTLSHNWLVPTLHVMHIHSYLAQALAPGSDALLQLPHVEPGLVSASARPENVVASVREKSPEFADDISKAEKHLGRLDVSDVYFKVLGERIITPGSIVNLVFQARILPPTVPRPAVSEAATSNGKSERHQTFWASKRDTEELSNATAPTLAHTPFLANDRKPQWWVFVADQRQNRIFVPPMQFSDVPFSTAPSSSTSSGGEDRLYKLTFQAPPSAGTLSLQVHFVSDTFVGDDVRRPILLKVEDLTALTAEEQGAEDDISDPEEDTLAGQMAALRGGSVKRVPAEDEEDDEDSDDSTTDGGKSDSSDSDSDSD